MIFHEKECQGVDVATHRFSRDVLLSSALFVWAADARCMLVSVFGAAISGADSAWKHRLCFRSQVEAAVAGRDMGKTS